MNKKTICTGLTLAALAGAGYGCAGTNVASGRTTADKVFEEFYEEIYEGKILINGKETEIKMGYSTFSDYSVECRLWLPMVRATDDKTYWVKISDTKCDSTADAVTVYETNGCQSETDSCLSTERAYTRKQFEGTTYLNFFDDLAAAGLSVLLPENRLGAKAVQKALDEVMKSYQKKEDGGK